jgi:cell division transport system permease protein
VKAWLHEHALALLDSAGRMVRHSPATLLNVLVIGLALSLPAGLFVAIKSATLFAPERTPEAQLTVFMTISGTNAQVATIADRLRSHPAVARAEIILKDKALETLRGTAGLAGVVEELGRNPLPDAVVVSARPGALDQLDELRDEVRGWPAVEHVQLDSIWARQLEDAMRAGRRAVALVGVLLAVGLVAVTFNTIRLQVLARREEIEVSKLIGATNAFIRRPFLYFGTLQCLLGALLAWGLVWAATRSLESHLGSLLDALGPERRLPDLSAPEAGLLALLAATIGWAGAWMSVSFFLRKLDP